MVVATLSLFFDRQTHTDRGLPFSVAVDGLLSGMDEAKASLGVTSKLIMCFLRHLDEDAAFATLKAAEPYLGRIAAVGLDSSELGHPPSKFARVFQAARARGLKLVAHAGEEGPPEYVWEALDVLGVDRIDHGNRALEDADLMRPACRERALPSPSARFPTSSSAWSMTLGVHPLKRMLDLGLKATINLDDPAYFGGYLAENWLQTASALNLDRDALVTLARNSFTGSFLTQAEAASHLEAIDAYVATACG